MHIDHSKLLELLTEASGLNQETVEKHLLKLVSEIKEALDEGEAYEVDGFGVFSKIGENTLFIPSEDLATEINYKYAGMSPILLDDDHDITEPAATDETDDEDDPFSGLLDDITETEEEPEGEFDNIDTSDVDDLSDPFALDDEGSAEEEETEDVSDEEEFTQIPNEFGYRPERTDEESRVLFSGLLEEEEDEIEEEPFGSDEISDEQQEPDLEPDLVFNKLDTEDEEDYNDPFDLGDEDILSEEDAEEEVQDEETEPVSEAEAGQPEEIDDQAVEADDGIEAFETPDEISDEEETEEDPFEALAGDLEDEDILEEEENIFATKKEVFEDPSAKKSAKEVVPVIKNVASEKQRNKKKSGKTDRPKTPKKPMEPASKQPAPVFLWVVLFIVVVAGGVYGLGYFGVVNIPGITPAASSSQQMASQQNEQPEPETPSQQTPQEATADADQQATEDPVSEQADQPQETTDQPEEPIQETTEENESTTGSTAPPQGQAEYGMDGVPVGSANDGYTIVVFSLSDQENAAAKKTELESDGYRVLLVEVPSPQYGSLWRVSLGQFESLRDAAIAAEDLDASLSGNYFITKIQ